MPVSSPFLFLFYAPAPAPTPTALQRTQFRFRVNMAVPSQSTPTLSSPPKRKCRASTIRYILTLSIVTLFGLFWGINRHFHSILDMPPPKESLSPPRATVAYAVSLTSCGHASTSTSGKGGHSSDPNLYQGAAVLARSIHLSSIRNLDSHSVYDYKLVAFVHSDAVGCSRVFGELGYEVMVRQTPFNVTNIKGKFLREHIVKSGCCGEKEYLKLYSYTLLEYPIVVHLDLDSLILKPLDDLFDAMLEPKGGSRSAGIPVMFGDALPTNNPIDAFFTRDYNMVNPGHEHVGIQGGFLVVRPNLDAFSNYIDVVVEGNFVQGNGWGGIGYGGYFGAQQGICSYYYDHLHPGTAVELNRCYYNAMADEPRQKEKAPTKPGQCRDGRETCQDCRDVNVTDVSSVHFTLCQKPWHCPNWGGMDLKTASICEGFHTEWFRIRDDLEKWMAGGRYNNPGGGYKPEIFGGYCKSDHARGYVPIVTGE